jgi:hypothetical protein
MRTSHLLVYRLHVDLRRQASALCRPRLPLASSKPTGYEHLSR